jgi:hypothetical protein
MAVSGFVLPYQPVTNMAAKNQVSTRHIGQVLLAYLALLAGGVHQWDAAGERGAASRRHLLGRPGVPAGASSPIGKTGVLTQGHAIGAKNRVLFRYRRRDSQ